MTFADRDPIPPLPPAIPTRDSTTRRGYTSSIGNTALVAFNWLRPDDNGGSPIINYQLYIDDGLGSSAFTQYTSSVHGRQTLTVSAATAFTVS